MTVYTFRLRRIIGDQPSSIHAFATVFRASRPIFGTSVDLGLMGFATQIGPCDYGREGFIRENLALDAEVIEWVSAQDALAFGLAFIAAEYPDQVGEHDDDHDLLYQVWQDQCGMDKVQVAA